MRFGVFYEHQLPRPWEDGAEAALITNALEQVEIADRAGIDVVWEVEHHFLEEYSHSSAPEVFLAAASQRTRRIRLGHGIVQLPPAFNHPVRVAERAATLDIVSGGRLELGTGEASSQMELGGFGVDREQKRAQWEESLDALTRMFVETPFAGLDGRHLRIPPRNVVPKPVQRPHPPLWVACSRRETILLAARKGIGALSFSFVDPEEARGWVDDYHRIAASEECVPAGFDTNFTVAVVLPFMCHEDEDTAIARGIDGAHFFGYSLAHYYVFGEHRPGRTDLWAEFQRDREVRGFSRDIVRPDQGPLGVRLLQQGLGSLRGAIGTPAQVADLVRRYEAAGVDQVILVAQAGPNRHEHVCESLELFGRTVLPEFAQHADDRDAQRRERLAEARERALARRPPPRQAAEHVVTTQGEPAFGASSPPPSSAPRAPGSPLHDLRSRLGSLSSGAAARVTARAGAERLDRLGGRAAVQRTLLTGMCRRYAPGAGAAVTGDIEYHFVLDGRDDTWTLRLDRERATLRRGPAASPLVTLRMPPSVFLRLASRELDPGRALVEGSLEIEGDLQVAARLGELFGGSSPW